MKHILVIALHVASIVSAGTDAYYTNRNSHGRHFVEYDSFAKPFVTHGPVERGAFFAGYAGVAVGGAVLLRHYHHDYLALAVQGLQIEENTRGAYFSAKH